MHHLSIGNVSFWKLQHQLHTDQHPYKNTTWAQNITEPENPLLKRRTLIVSLTKHEKID